MRDRRWSAWAGVLWAVAVSWFAIAALMPTAVLPAGANADLFAAGRAQTHVEAIARVPHPMGSNEAQRIREYLIQQLKALGLEPEVQSPRQPLDSPARNVLARLTGQGLPGKKALLFCAHYDSVANGPGAGDNASGVAVVLESLRALKAGSPLIRDVIALFDDGEENGFHGSRLFVDEHPWAREIGVVLNFDARGNTGPSFMFETSNANGWLIRQFARAVPHPVATSLSMDIYKVMPNDTDLTIFKRAGMAGLNFAFSDGLAIYHSPADIPKNLDPRTLQHHGENALAAARWFGQLDLDDRRSDDLIYTSILSRWLLLYPVSWAIPLAVVTTLLFVVVVVVSLRTARMRLIDLAAGAGLILSMILTIGLLFVLELVALARRLVSFDDIARWQKSDVMIMTGLATLTVMATLVLERASGRKRPLTALSLGALSCWLVLSLATAIWLPGASYLFVWPTLFGLLSLGISASLRPGSMISRAATLIASIPVLVLLPPVIRLTFTIGLHLVPPVMVLVVLLIGATLELFEPLIATECKASARPGGEVVCSP